MTDKTYEELTAADKTSIGFEYQYYYFLNKLLELKKGEKLGYEVKDDVHIELADGKFVMIQTKHTLKTNANEDPANLTERDIDLWKTIYNWIGVINDGALGRDSLSKQLAFISNTEFVLASNKSDNERNAFLTNIRKCQKEEMKISEFRTYVNQLIGSTKEPKKGESKLKLYMTSLSQQSEEWLESFILQLKFDLDQDDLIQSIRTKIAEKIYEDDDSRIDDVFSCVNSQTSVWKFTEVKKGNKLEITFDEVKQRFYKCFHNARSKNLPNRNFKITLPEQLEEQIFIKQLVDIEDVEPTDTVIMAEFTTEKLRLSKSLESWIQQSYITEDERRQFEEESIVKWRTSFRRLHRRRSSTKSPIDSALECLDSVREFELEIQNQKIGTSLSHGLFYSLSDRPSIGWLPDWEARYKK
ncbi:hypothetical protein QYF52_15550 [Paenibacillus polymyxa]|uniref:hypothetical protein n=1 Tax=Paenibacillus polymyxa TaxID=1406 RepID=UPI0025B72958|nr:hypothetical protein [Paenibacillus polymyxa]MDN4079362.1 hypothetical protein [Paenibacillus polymyxa]MDN4104783.1 hypothetical protein [Paenibacillus polymyxa]MDN4115180.1 hypothetical protein [Paenibacillus polymyxa]